KLDLVIYGNHVSPSVAANCSGCLKRPLRYSQLLELVKALDTRPAAQEALATEGTSASAGNHASTPSLPLNARVLIAEDNPVNQKVAQRLLARLRVSCDLVADGQQALEAVQRNRYDLVLMDWQM